ncbi:uncharacterized protein ARMOST_07878 [Armillaria ostoyae]|uniref:Epidermal growth factor receptor-like transmembrane-juxtamembrane segment domain-containing protein n=1 Tax=Armillaria ostoyae TaxID=47428 RepID=A0A284R704_ARMOS|nr:uncharacterized protein ARMOST_07878 [Armillaria ostoyae]
MSPVTLQVVQDSPSGYLMSSGVPDLFWSSSKTRRNGEGHPDGKPSQCDSSECSGAGNGNQTHSMSDGATPSTGSESSAQSSQGSPTLCSTITTPTASTTISTRAAGSDATESNSLTASIPSSSASPSSLLSSSATSAVSSTQAKPHSNTGAIIGGIVGGVVLLSIAALILFIFLRRRRRMKHTAPSAEFMHPNSPFQRLNTARSGSPTRTRSVFDMLPSPNNGDAGGKSLLRSLSRRDYKSPPTLEKVTVDTTSAVHAL